MHLGRIEQLDERFIPNSFRGEGSEGETEMEGTGVESVGIL